MWVNPDTIISADSTLKMSLSSKYGLRISVTTKKTRRREDTTDTNVQYGNVTLRLFGYFGQEKMLRNPARSAEI